MYQKSITKDEINELPIVKFTGKMHIVIDQDSCLSAIEALSSEAILGFDTETKPAFKKGVSHKVSLLQLSTNDDAYLFRLNKCNLTKELCDLLANPNIIKAGVSIRDDIRGLNKLNNFEPGGFVELGDLAKKLEIKQLGLRSLAGMFLGYRVSKRFQLTNWELPKLTEDQFRYAATDAWVGLCLYNKMQNLFSS